MPVPKVFRPPPPIEQETTVSARIPLTTKTELFRRAKARGYGTLGAYLRAYLILIAKTHDPVAGKPQPPPPPGAENV
jgi:hypothetical protein